MEYPAIVFCAMCRTRDHEDIEMLMKYEFGGPNPENGFRVYKCPDCAHETVMYERQGPRRGQL